MIKAINKDILTVDRGVIVHSVNCVGAIGGLAGAIARKWPENAEKYREHVSRYNPQIMLLGSILQVRVAHNLVVANLFGQNSIGTGERRTEYSALIAGFNTINRTFFVGDDYLEGKDSGFLNTLDSIYIPYKIGCGLGGADWDIVEGIIHEIFKKSSKHVYICKHE